jgi:hypothetical protein
MNVSKQDIENFSRKLLNIQKPPVLWSSIRIDGNCFFHAIDYAYTGKLLPRDSNKIIELRQNIVSTMKRNKISGVSYEEFMNARRNGKKIPWPYAEIDVIIATSKYYQRPIIVISMNQYGGVTMIRPKNVKIDSEPLFLICEDTIHYVPYHSNRIKITNSMRNKLIQIEKNKTSNGAIEDEKDVCITTFLLRDLDDLYSGLINSLSLTRKRLGKKNKNKTSKSTKSVIAKKS